MIIFDSLMNPAHVTNEWRTIFYYGMFKIFMKLSKGDGHNYNNWILSDVFILVSFKQVPENICFASGDFVLNQTKSNVFLLAYSEVCG